MTLIRCLGTISLPQSYRQHMREEIGHFKRKTNEGSSVRLNVELLPEKSLYGHEEFLRRKQFFKNGEIVQVNKPYYKSERGLLSTSKPCSLLNVSFVPNSKKA